MTKNFQKKLILSFLLIFALCTVGILFFEHPSDKFMYLAIAIFAIGLAFISYVARYFGKSIRQLRDFSQMLGNEIDKIVIPKFKEDELNDIAAKILDDLRRTKEDEKLLAQQKEKLLLHAHASAEGICFFNADETSSFYNGLFLQYFNIISNSAVITDRYILHDKCFEPVMEFMSQRINEEYFETHISKHGHDFLLRMNIFEDKSFEIILVDISSKEKNRRLKQEMTGNIAHELRTPVTSIRGFLEILINNNIAEEKRREYLQRAFMQTQVLSELISDMSLLAKIDAKAESLKSESVNISQLIAKVRSDISADLQSKRIAFSSDVPENLTVSGNPGLLYSIFRNLSDNVIRHAGDGADISIKMSDANGGKANFIFADNGKGVEDGHHLLRLFERFYRVHSGRTRDTGGSGLGLSIVKNAVLFHGGTIIVRKGKERGLEFLFSLANASMR